MRKRFLGSMITLASAGAAVSAGISMSITRTLAQAPAASAAAPAPALKTRTLTKTPWDEPDLQGIWTDETDTPLQRPAQYAGQERFTEAQRAEWDRQRRALACQANRAQRG